MSLTEQSSAPFFMDPYVVDQAQPAVKNITFRQLNAEDFATFYAIRTQARTGDDSRFFCFNKDDLLPADHPSWKQRSRNDETNAVFAAFDGIRPIAMMVAAKSEATSKLIQWGSVFVSPEYRGKFDVGETLYKMRESWSRARCEIVEFFIDIENKRSTEIHTKNHAQKFGEPEQMLMANGEVRIVQWYRKSLTQASIPMVA